jgi:hypothetical protein
MGCPRRRSWTKLRTPVCSYPIIVTHLSFNFLCLLLLYSIYLNGSLCSKKSEKRVAARLGIRSYLNGSLCSKKSEKRVAARLGIRSEWACLSEDSCLGVSWQRRAGLASLTLFLIRDHQGRTLIILSIISKSYRISSRNEYEQMLTGIVEINRGSKKRKKTNFLTCCYIKTNQFYN